MDTGRFGNYWPLVIILLVAVIVVGGIVAWSRYSRSQSIEISILPDKELQGEIYIGGEVSNPGIYPLKAGDSLEDIIRAAGGTTDSADLSQLRLQIPGGGGEGQLQKVNINHAEAWLLQALPGIGETRAQAIVNYRQQNGPFRNINELVKVEGIGITTYEKIKHLITVVD